VEAELSKQDSRHQLFPATPSLIDPGTEASVQS